MNVQTDQFAPYVMVPTPRPPSVSSAEAKELNLYVSFPPLASSVPCLMEPGNTVWSVKDNRYHPRTASVAFQLASPLKPGHPVCCLRVARVRVDGMRVAGTGQPEMSLQRNVRA